MKLMYLIWNLYFIDVLILEQIDFHDSSLRNCGTVIIALSLMTICIISYASIYTQIIFKKTVHFEISFRIYTDC